MKGVQILKIQKPISPEGAPLLIYNEDRSFQAVMEEVEPLSQMDFLKLYVRAKVIGDTLKILSVLPESENPNW